MKSVRKVSFAEGEHYHIYNRGTEKRTIVVDDQDFARFLQSMVEFNVPDPVGSLYQNSFHQNDNQLRSLVPKYRASWDEYVGKVKEKICCTDSVLGQLRNRRGYADFAENSVTGTLARRGVLDEALLLE